MLRRVELNGRNSSESRDGWSIRQTAVYHQYTMTSKHPAHCASLSQQCLSEPKSHSPIQSSGDTKDKSMFLLVAVSKNAADHLDQCVERSHARPWELQHLLVADSLRNWSDYMACLKAELSKQKKRIIDTQVGSKADKLETSINIDIKFDDRQELAEIQDATQELELILPVLLQTVQRVRDQCQRTHCTSTMSSAEAISFEFAMGEFEEFVCEAESLVVRAEALVKQAKSATNLVSILPSTLNGPY